MQPTVAPETFDNHSFVKYNIPPDYYFIKVLEDFQNYNWVLERTNNINGIIKN